LRLASQKHRLEALGQLRYRINIALCRLLEFGLTHDSIVARD
jgi:hypothetical protein